MNLQASLDEIADEVHENAREKGFHDGPIELFLPNQLNNLHAEVSELWDAHRAGKLDDDCDKSDGMRNLNYTPLSNIEEEYADIIIRTLDQCRRLQVDISRAVMVKHEYNKTRPHMHGKRN